MARGYTKITPQMFNAVKTLLKGGAKQTEAAEYMGLSQNTVSRLAHAETYEEYVQIAYKNGCGRYKDKATETPALTDDKQKGGTLTANYQINRIIALLNEQNETLKLLSNNVAFIVEELTK